MRILLLAWLLICMPASAGVLPLVPTFIAGGGGGNFTPALSNKSATCTAFGATATVDVVFNTDGKLTIDRGVNCTAGDTDVTDEWHEGWPITGIGSNFYVERTVTAGSLTTDAGACQALSTARTYGVSQGSLGTKAATVDFEIFSSGSCTGTAAASATISFSATYDSF